MAYFKANKLERLSNKSYICATNRDNEMQREIKRAQISTTPSIWSSKGRFFSRRPFWWWHAMHLLLPPSSCNLSPQQCERALSTARRPLVIILPKLINLEKWKCAKKTYKHTRSVERGRISLCASEVKEMWSTEKYICTASSMCTYSSLRERVPEVCRTHYMHHFLKYLFGNSCRRSVLG